ncbi:hypothetical protein BH11MYX1_BH11MYX1_28870 [soil metagenome]
MSTRDPRARPPRTEPPRAGQREQTQSLQLEIEDAGRDSHPSLAVGTHGDERTRVESPSARNAPPSSKPPPLPTRSPDDPEIRIGQTFGTYKLQELLGKGGMGYVYRAEHTKLGREVALKLLRADYAKRRDAVNRFFQEAKTVNRVRHRNIVDVTDFVELDDGTTFIIMEYLRGQSLGKWSRSGIDLPRALAVLVQICDGLGAAHAVGVVHRDLKPDNVIVVPTTDGAEMVKLLDFGVAKLVNRDDEDVGFQTQAGSVIGTPAYMSPEQAGGMQVDQRSDIYSLGAIMYELFCGQPLFRGRSFGEFVRKHLTENPIPPHQTQDGAGIDPNLEALIMRCLAKDPNDRFGHILELRDGLLHLLGGATTHPGAISGVHPPSGLHRPLPIVMAVDGLPNHMLPLPPPSHTTQPTPNPAPYSPQYQVLPTVPTGVGQIASPTPAPYNHYTSTAATNGSAWPRYIGFGSIAVGVGVVCAMLYLHRSQTDPAPAAVTAPPPLADPPALADPPPVAKSPAQQVELRFDSLPSAGIYEAGHAAELCRTPCAFNVEVGADGNARGTRSFIVRSDGYLDKSIVVDLAAAKREFHVTLDRDLTASEAGSDEPARKPRGKQLTKQVVKKATLKPDKPDKPDETVKPVVEDPPELKKKPGGTEPAGGTTIDPTDTHDPFKSHK